jgi:tRNA pseudouridine13 synthase
MLRGSERLPRDQHQRRLLVSALQSHIFNEALRRRVERRQLGQLLGGEVLQRTDSGGMFTSEDRAADQPRLEAGAVALTGPICGPRMPRPLAGSPAAAEEDALFAELEIAPDDFARFGRLARGGRRPLTVPIAGAAVTALTVEDRPALRLDFALPAGAYATVLLREVTKESDPRSAAAVSGQPAIDACDPIADS